MPSSMNHSFYGRILGFEPADELEPVEIEDGRLS
jgi:hypothetical protein